MYERWRSGGGEVHAAAREVHKSAAVKPATAPWSVHRLDWSCGTRASSAAGSSMPVAWERVTSSTMVSNVGKTSNADHCSIVAACCTPGAEVPWVSAEGWRGDGAGGGEWPGDGGLNWCAGSLPAPRAAPVSVDARPSRRAA